VSCEDKNGAVQPTIKFASFLPINFLPELEHPTLLGCHLDTLLLWLAWLGFQKWLCPANSPRRTHVNSVMNKQKEEEEYILHFA